MKTGWKSTSDKITEIEKVLEGINRVISVFYKRFERVEKSIEKHEARFRDLHDLELEFKKLTCEHSTVEVKKQVIAKNAGEFGALIATETSYIKTCLTCGKFIEEISEQDYYAQKIIEKKKELDNLIAQGKDLINAEKI